MYIGQLAKLSGVSRKSIHHYEALGLIPVPKRKGIYRLYQDQDVDLIKMIKCAQTLGFKLKELADIAVLQSQDDAQLVSRLLGLIAQKREAIQAQIQAAQQQDLLLASLEDDFRTKLHWTCTDYA